MTTTKTAKAKAATKAKATKAPVAKPAQALKSDKAPKVTKKQIVTGMLKEGTTVEAIVARLECSPVAARALIGDVRRAGTTITFDRESAVYKVA